MVKRVSVFTLVVGYLVIGRACVAATEVEGLEYYGVRMHGKMVVVCSAWKPGYARYGIPFSGFRRGCGLLAVAVS